LIETFKENPKNTILFVDGKYEAQGSFSPFLSNANCRLHICPLDTRINAINAYSLLRQHSPKRIVVSPALEALFSKLFKPRASMTSAYTPTDTMASVSGNQGYNPEIITMTAFQTTKVKMERSFEKGFISSALSASILPKPLSSTDNKSGNRLPAIALVKGQLSHRDGSFMIHPPFLDHSLESTSTTSSSSTQYPYPSSKSVKQSHGLLFGSFAPSQILEDLESLGIDQFEYLENDEDSPQSSSEKSVIRVRIPQLEATICFSNSLSATRVISNKIESRKLLKEVIMRHLTK
jgi:hypothetical protein